MAKVILRNITKSFENVVAVNKLDLTVDDKEFVVLLGPSGCGKTTTLNLIAGLERQNEGHVYFDDELVDEKPPDKRNIAMVFQSYALYPHMNAFDNISFGLKIKKMSPQEIKKRVKNASEILRIEHLLSRKPHQLSGGERQRVALARAIVRSPRVFLLDEPLSNLDAQLRLQTRVELKRLHRELHTTFIYVTHDQVEALTMADRIALMNQGRLQQYDAPDTIYKHPANLFVAGFVGSPPMNFIECSFLEKEERPYLDAGLFSLDVSNVADQIKNLGTGSEFILGFRPDDVKIYVEPSNKDLIETEVYAVEPLGSEVILDLKFGDKIVKVRTEPDLKLNVGNKVWMSLEKDKVYVFDRKTGAAIA